MSEISSSPEIAAPAAVLAPSRVAPMDAADMRRRLKAIFIGSVGNLVEWYDFYAYAAFSLYFAHQFFPGDDPVVQQLNAALLFAFGFLVRPLGGVLFGHIADRHGRRLALMLSVALMCFGSLIIAVTPTYATIGVAAPIMLFVARLIQGLSLGGEYGTSATYLSEVAHERHRGFFSSFQYVTLIGGQLVAIIVLLLLQKAFLTPDQLKSWGWRIPFAFGACLAVVAAVMRRELQETEAFTGANKASKAHERESSLQALMRYPREVMLVVGMTMGGTAAFYTYTTYYGMRKTIGVFQLKEHIAVIGLIMLPAYWHFWHTVPLAQSVHTRRFLTTLLALFVWWNLVVGHILNNIKGLH